jgi:Helix-turn-helix
MGRKPQFKPNNVKNTRNYGIYVEPNRSLSTKPSSQTVLFVGKFISLTTIHLYTDISMSHLSMIFQGKRHPSLKVARKIALALNMDLSVFVHKLDQHVSRETPYLQKVS